MNKAGTVAWVRHLRGHTFATPIVAAQFSVPPQIGLEPPQGALPARDISAEVERMTKRHGLSEDKAKIVHAILEEQARKADDVAKDNSLSPEEKVHRMLAIKDEETTRVSDALTQRKKYLVDVRPAPPPAGSPAEAPTVSSPNKQ
ncbi:hypothetical protein [Edaphobacter aggregans]|uniref:hypothetical protein n=1 Tax=Edaphobacter aggregans TaxID=570835 RepID=UPI00055151A4|nr:hypothetical protein [Edaphobacter aggregans]